MFLTTKTREVVATIGTLVGAKIECAHLEVENLELPNRLEARKLIERAKGLLQKNLNVPESDAYRMMQKESREQRKSMRDVAEAVLLADNLNFG